MKPFAPQDIDKSEHRARILVFGNEKGGCGKSTLAMHVAIGLLRLGFSVGSIDLDSRQGSFSRYLRNRFDTVRRLEGDVHGLEGMSPTHIRFMPSGSDADKGTRRNLHAGTFLTGAINELSPHHDFIIIDTAGRDCYINRLAHSFADTVITPVNPSYIDLDLIADINPVGQSINGAGLYTAMIAEQRRNKLSRVITEDISARSIDWIVVPNRLQKKTDQNAHMLKEQDFIVNEILPDAAQKFDFKMVSGFTERALFRDLFLKGLTLLDLAEVKQQDLSLDIVQARQEVRTVVEAIGLRRSVGRRVSASQVFLNRALPIKKTA